MNQVVVSASAYNLCQCSFHYHCVSILAILSVVCIRLYIALLVHCYPLDHTQYVD